MCPSVKECPEFAGEREGFALVDVASEGKFVVGRKAERVL